MERRNSLIVNLDALEHNIHVFQQKQSNKRMIGVIKANGYGCGDLVVAKVLMQNGVGFVAVSSIYEAIHIKQHLPLLEVLILGVTFKEDLELAKKHNIVVTVPSYDWCIEASSCLNGLRVHIKCDTGMNRLGCKSSLEVQHCLSILNEKGAIVEGIFSHFACSDCDDNVSSNQFALFKQWVSEVNYNFQWVHIDNSDGSLKYQEDFTNAYRVGIGLYGYSSVTNTVLKPVVSLYSRIALCKNVNKGEKVSYGLTHTFDCDGYIGVLPIGYADGLLRDNQNRLVYCNGNYYPIVGRICMDQTMIFSQHTFKKGSDVEIFGEHIHLETMAKELGTIGYEILCTISDRVPRYYVQNNRIVKDLTFRKD